MATGGAASSGDVSLRELLESRGNPDPASQEQGRGDQQTPEFMGAAGGDEGEDGEGYRAEIPPQMLIGTETSAEDLVVKSEMQAALSAATSTAEFIGALEKYFVRFGELPTVGTFMTPELYLSRLTGPIEAELKSFENEMVRYLGNMTPGDLRRSMISYTDFDYFERHLGRDDDLKRVKLLRPKFGMFRVFSSDEDFYSIEFELRVIPPSAEEQEQTRKQVQSLRDTQTEIEKALEQEKDEEAKKTIEKTLQETKTEHDALSASFFASMNPAPISDKDELLKLLKGFLRSAFEVYQAGNLETSRERFLASSLMTVIWAPFVLYLSFVSAGLSVRGPKRAAAAERQETHRGKHHRVPDAGLDLMKESSKAMKTLSPFLEMVTGRNATVNCIIGFSPEQSLHLGALNGPYALASYAFKNPTLRRALNDLASIRLVIQAQEKTSVANLRQLLSNSSVVSREQMKKPFECHLRSPGDFLGRLTRVQVKTAPETMKSLLENFGAHRDLQVAVSFMRSFLPIIEGSRMAILELLQEAATAEQ